MTYLLSFNMEFRRHTMKRFLAAFILIFTILTQIQIFAENNTSTLINERPLITQQKIDEIDNYIKRQMKKGKIPGLSIVITEGDKTVCKKSYGYSDLKSKQPVTSDTLFEIGSMTKAFTGLGILYLQEKGLLELDDPVSKYLPWLWMQYKGKKEVFTIEQCLHQTTGIPSETTGFIPVTNNAETGIEETVRILVGQELDRHPGEEAIYATINYDILGLIIQKVSGQTYEQFMKENIIGPLGLKNTYISREDFQQDRMAQGYKVGFTRALKYDPPSFRGNTPAGYAISNINDMEAWLKIQLGMNSKSDLFNQLINESHIPDRTVNPFISYGQTYGSYGAGWDVCQVGEGGLFFHAGSNPTYSSSIAFKPEEKLGVAVVSNMNSGYVLSIAPYIIDMIMDKWVPEARDSFVTADKACFTVICIAAFFSLIILVMIVHILVEIIKSRRKFAGMDLKKSVYLLLSVLFVVFLGYCMYRIRDVMFSEYPWEAIIVWGPSSVIVTLVLMAALILLFFIYFTLSSLFTMEGEKSLFMIAILSILSGFGNALVIFIINQTLDSLTMNPEDYEFPVSLLLFFIIGLIVYVVGQQLIRSRLINITNNYVYDKRMELTDKILKMYYRNMEELKDGKIQSGLNNDPETVSNFANIIVTGVTALVTLIACFIYLGFINMSGLLVSMVVIIVLVGIYYAVGRRANTAWEHTRDIQNVFFGFINDIIYGFKELNLNMRKRKAFNEDMSRSCLTYRNKRIYADVQFASAFIVGELLFTLVIGAVAFIFPLIFKNIENSTLTSFIFVYIYMTGPVRAILTSIPNIFQMKVSYNRLSELINEISTMEITEINDATKDLNNQKVNLELKEVEFAFKNLEGSDFKVGPINLSFHSSQITFITGGNGSGKSTLAKLLTGLYKADKGEILLNNSNIDLQSLKEQYSTIYSDYYLFQKLYGVDFEQKERKIEEYLEQLHIRDKVQITNGIFSSTSLSTGQRKRLALLVSYLEDKPILLFDEWAADQDPEYRKYFYNNLLPELKKEGKCIIAVTHDDSYFDVADQLVKMEMGTIVKLEKRAEAKMM